MSELYIDLESLRSAGTQLSKVKGDFQNAENHEGAIADSVKHASLRDALGEFGTNWKHEREKMLKSMEGLSEAAIGIADSFKQLDADLAAELEKGLKSGGTSPPRGPQAV